MSLFIYQIGNVVVSLAPSSVAGLEVTIPRSFRGEPFQSSVVPDTFFNNIPYQLPEPIDMTLKGTIICKSGQNVSDQVNALMSLGGTPYVDIIGYLPNECCSISGPCNTCGNCGSLRCAQWVTSTAFITQIDPSWSIDDASSAVWPTEMIPFEMDITVGSYWMPLNPWLWEPYFDGAPVSGLRQIENAYRSIIPCKPQLYSPMREDYMIFNRKNYVYPFDMYDTIVWENTPESVGRGWGEWENYQVGTLSSRWSGPPTSNYQFTNLPTTGQLQINVESEIGGYNRMAHSSQIDLASLNQQLISLGLLGIKTSDILIATDSVYSPSVYVRDGVILDITPIWTYQYAYIGQLLGPINRINIKTPDGVLSAHLHNYRML